MNNAPHIIRSEYNGLDMIGTISDDGEFYRVASASGPMAPNFTDEGEVTPGALLKLAYNYRAEEYAPQTGWACSVVRVNRRTITVRDFPAGKNDGKTFKIEWN